MKLFFAAVFISFTINLSAQQDTIAKSKAWLNEITPFYALCTYGGINTSINQNTAAPTQYGVGLLTPGFPYANYLFNIKKKFYIGGMIGEQLGLATTDKGYIAPIGRLNWGVTAAWQFNKHTFLAVNHYMLSQIGTYIKNGQGNGWVIGANLRYKRLMLDITTNLKGVPKDGPLNGRMSSNYWQLFPKYMFQHNNAKVPFWVGLRFESYESTVIQNNLSAQITNFEFVIGKIIPINPK